MIKEINTRFLWKLSGAKVVIACRDPKKAKDAVDEINQKLGTLTVKWIQGNKSEMWQNSPCNTIRSGIFEICAEMCRGYNQNRS